MIKIMGKTIPSIEKTDKGWYFKKQPISYNIYKIKNLLFVKVSEIIDRRVPQV